MAIEKQNIEAQTDDSSIPLWIYDYKLTIIPPGIGVSFLADDYWPIETPLKLKYLLFGRDTYKLLAGRLNVKLVESSSLGDLYCNFDSGCAANR